MRGFPCVVLLLAGLRVPLAATPDLLLHYHASSASLDARRWPGEPGPDARLAGDVLRVGDGLAFSGRGNPPALSGVQSPAGLPLPTRAFTVEVVASVENAGEWGGFLGFLQDNGGEESGWVLGHHQGRFTFAVASKGADDGNGAMTYLDGATRFDPGRLYHVVGVYDGAEMRLHVNGVPEGRSAKQKGDILYPAKSALVLAGYRDSNESYPLCGRLGLVRLLNRAWSDAEVESSFVEWKDACAAPPVLTAGLPRAAHAVRPANTVGVEADGSVTLPVLQRLTPAGRQVVLPGLRPQALAVAPDESYVVATGRSAELVLIDPRTGAELGRVPMPSGQTTAPPSADHILAADPKAQVSFTGLAWSPDHRRLVLSNVGGSLKVFATDPVKRLLPLFSIPLPETVGLTRKQEIPAGLAFSADGSRLFVAGNLSNRLLELDAAEGRFLRALDVGVAPYDVVILKGKAYVSNWGGRRPDAESRTHEAGRGTRVRVDARDVASEGSVSVIDLAAWKVEREILTGRHACALAADPSGRWLAVANANDDTVSLLDTTGETPMETVNLAWQPQGLAGAIPNALAWSADSQRLFVCNGGQNAVAVVAVKPGRSAMEGLIPVGWFPGAIRLLPRAGLLAVANIKGLGSGAQDQRDGKPSSNSHHHTGSVSLLELPSRKELAAHTAAVFANTRRTALDAAFLPPRPEAKPVPVPERVGEPSVIKHVVYIIKENRTYDQVLGDLPQGRGDPFLCVFGEEVTPNQHQLCRDFVLLDNTHCCGVLSADGHQWSTAGYVTDYLEKSFAGFPRSYPDLCGTEDHDGLAYSPGGFLWDAALAKGRSVRNFGESSGTNEAYWRDRSRKGKPGYRDIVADWKSGARAVGFRTTAGLASLREHTVTNTVGWLTHVPDVARASVFLEHLRDWETAGAMPDLCVMALPQDHTNGTGPGQPTPAACVADNDLAVGLIVEGLSKSKFWGKTAIFIIEDDPQAGWDHVSPYRTTAYVVSPWCKRGAVVSELYSQTSLLRTMELILGLPPMNQFDAIATPMTACFTDQPNLTPFTHLPNRIPLDEMNPQARDIRDPLLRHDALVSAKLPLHRIDACPEDLFNRILWRARKGTAIPYPEWAVFPEDALEEDEDEDG